MTLFYIASMLKPLISSLGKTEIWSFKCTEYKPLEITPEAIAAAALGKCWRTLGPPQPCAHEAPILLSLPPASAAPDPAAGNDVPGVDEGRCLGMLPASVLDRRTPGDPQPANGPAGPCSALGLNRGATGGKRGEKTHPTIALFVFCLVSLVKLQWWKILKEKLQVCEE